MIFKNLSLLLLLNTHNSLTITVVAGFDKGIECNNLYEISSRSFVERAQM